MTPNQYSEYIIRRLEEVNQRYPEQSQHLYEKGILIGMLASLAYRDSMNLDLVRSQFNKLTKD